MTMSTYRKDPALVGRFHADLTPFHRRRTRVLDAMRAHGDSALVLPTAPERIRNRDAHYPYRFDSDFYYLTGCTEPQAWLVLRTFAEPQAVLFCRPRDAQRERWDGRRVGVDAAASVFGVEAAYDVGELPEKLPELLAGAETVWAPIFENEAWDSRWRAVQTALAAKQRQGIQPPASWRSVRQLLAPMRLVKDEFELALMRQAAAIAAEAHRRAMLAARRASSEAELEAVLLAAFRELGAEGPSYSPIVAAGANACVLHYTQNDAAIRDGDLVLIDAGCEYAGYASDITRTFPARGRFTGATRDLYALVLAAQEAAVAATRPGEPYDAAHHAAVRTLVDGLKTLGLLAGDTEGLIEQKAFERFYPHRTGHWLGLDVHDVGAYRQGEEPTRLAAGMIITVEPGLYIEPADDIPVAFHGIGVRIEDDALVTENGCTLLTRDVPVAIDEIEAWMR